MRKFLTLLGAFTLAYVLAFPQTKTLTGRVTDQNGQPVPFATVRVKGTKGGVSANADGEYSIKADPTQTLLISGAGINTLEVVVTTASSMNIQVTRREAELAEVVVTTALGIKRSKNLLPYSAQTVGGDEVTKTRGDNFVSALSGKVSGLEIRQANTLGGSTNVVLRGYKSLTGNNQALFVIDGTPFDNSNTTNTGAAASRGGYDYGSAAADINPDDIESINILKGAAATALYGSRAANGVVLITTKKGRKGALGVTINSGVNVGSVDKSTFVKYQKLYGANYGSANGYGSADGNFLSFDVNGDGIDDLVTPTTEDASWGAKFDPNLQVYQWDAFDKSSPFFLKSRPWVAAANDPSTYFEKPVSLSNSVIIDGGSDKGTFKLGYTKNNDKGILPNSQINKDLLNFGATYKLTDRLTVGANVSYSQVRGLGRYGTGYDAKNPMTNFRQWWETNVDMKELKDAYFRTKQNVTWNWSDPGSLGFSAPAYWDNPYWDRYQNFETDSRSRYYGNVNLNYKITDWLNIMGRVGMDSYDEVQEERLAVGSIASSIGNITTNPPGSGYSRFNRSFRETNYDLLINFDKNIGRDLNLKALVGSNIRQTNVSSILAVTNGGLVVPGYYNLGNSVNPISAPQENETRVEVDGIFAGATLTWKDMLTLDVTERRDKSSTLPSTNNAYYYPSVAGGFIFSKLMDAPWLSYGKLRANYAEVGNSAPALSIKDTYVHDQLGSATNFGTAPLYSVASTKNNENLKPELSKSYELGLEMSFLKSRIGFDVSYYHTSSINQILPAAVSNATGYSYEYVNAGNVVNKGVEVTLNAAPVKTREFTWNFTVNWSKNTSKVVSLNNGANNLLVQDFGTVTSNATVGLPYGTIRGTNFVYTNGKKTVDGDGYYEISDNANAVIGNVNPSWIGGINNSFRYKSIALSFLIDVRQGGQLFSLDQYYGLATGLYPETAGNNDLGKPVRNTIADGGGIINPGVTDDGKANTKRIDISDFFGAYGYYFNPAARYIYDASYIKLRELAITYSFPSKTINKMGPVKGIDLSLIGRNLWIIHKNIPYADPEEIVTSGNGQGFQGGAYPSVRNIGFNVKVRF